MRKFWHFEIDGITLSVAGHSWRHWEPIPVPEMRPNRLIVSPGSAARMEQEVMKVPSRQPRIFFLSFGSSSIQEPGCDQ
jgi:hypothetical protein